jgi:hypothetical protein
VASVTLGPINFVSNPLEEELMLQHKETLLAVE